MNDRERGGEEEEGWGLSENGVKSDTSIQYLIEEDGNIICFVKYNNIQWLHLNFNHRNRNLSAFIEKSQWKMKYNFACFNAFLYVYVFVFV